MTHKSIYTIKLQFVSPHAGRDETAANARQMANIFQSTLPTRGETYRAHLSL